MAIDPSGRYLFIRFEGSADATDRLITAWDVASEGLVTIQQLRLLGRPDGPKQVTTFLQMLQHHRSLVHPNIAALLNVTWSSDRTYLCLVMEHTNAGTLQDHLSGFRHLVSSKKLNNDLVASADYARRFFQQLVLALDYLQQRGTAHRELRQSNLLLKVDPVDNSLQLKLFSFRFIKKYFDRWETNTVVSRDQYASPEMLSEGSHLGPEVDMWCAGTLLFHMLTGKYPFEQEPITTPTEQVEALQRRKDGTWQDGLPARISPDCRQLLAGLLRYEYSQRFTLDQVKQNPWFKRGWSPNANATPQQDLDAMEQAFANNLDYLSEQLHPPPCELDEKWLGMLTEEAIELLLANA